MYICMYVYAYIHVFMCTYIYILYVQICRGFPSSFVHYDALAVRLWRRRSTSSKKGSDRLLATGAATLSISLHPAPFVEPAKFPLEEPDTPDMVAKKGGQYTPAHIQMLAVCCEISPFLWLCALSFLPPGRKHPRLKDSSTCKQRVARSSISMSATWDW